MEGRLSTGALQEADILPLVGRACSFTLTSRPQHCRKAAASAAFSHCQSCRRFHLAQSPKEKQFFVSNISGRATRSCHKILTPRPLGLSKPNTQQLQSKDLPLSLWAHIPTGHQNDPSLCHSPNLPWPENLEPQSADGFVSSIYPPTLQSPSPSNMQTSPGPHCVGEDRKS